MLVEKRLLEHSFTRTLYAQFYAYNKYNIHQLVSISTCFNIFFIRILISFLITVFKLSGHIHAHAFHKRLTLQLPV